MNPCVTFEEALSFANQHPVCWLATSENQQPHVRGMLMWFADASGFYFHTGSTKPLADQITQNPRVEVAFNDPGQNRGDGRMLRIAGSAEILTSPALVERLKQERPWVFDNAAVAPGITVVMFHIPHGTATLWTMAVNCRERSVEPLRF
jgi:uncharacterized pyridoxamine 5'-phosphate oxidase family protein